MDKGQGGSLSHLFTLRLWPEALGEGQPEWRGKAQLSSFGLYWSSDFHP
jgi:hypothetical protein